MQQKSSKTTARITVSTFPGEEYGEVGRYTPARLE